VCEPNKLLLTRECCDVKTVFELGQHIIQYGQDAEESNETAWEVRVQRVAVPSTCSGRLFSSRAISRSVAVIVVRRSYKKSD